MILTAGTYVHMLPAPSGHCTFEGYNLGKAKSKSGQSMPIVVILTAFLIIQHAPSSLTFFRFPFLPPNQTTSHPVGPYISPTPPSPSNPPTHPPTPPHGSTSTPQTAIQSVKSPIATANSFPSLSSSASLSQSPSSPTSKPNPFSSSPVCSPSFSSAHQAVYTSSLLWLYTSHRRLNSTASVTVTLR